MPSGPDVTVIIPTYNRRELLVGCLESIAKQSLARERFEVVVVSDASTDDSVSAAHETGARLGLTLTVLEAPRGGPGRARNFGLRVAVGSVIAFTDDDVRVSSGWLEAGLRAFDSDDVGGVEGRIEALTLEHSLYRPNLVNPTGSLYPTANMFYRKDVLDRVGGFDPRFRKVREDSELAFRVLSAGYRIPFVSDAVVSHCAHHEAVTFPLRIATTIPECVFMSTLYPDRPEVRARPYLSDVAKVVLAVGSVALILARQPLAAMACVVGFLILVARAMHQQTRIEQARRERVLPMLAAVYALIPFVHLGYFAVGWLRVWRGWPEDSPGDANDPPQ